MFNCGDLVEIIATGNRETYTSILHKTGVIKTVRKYQCHEHLDITYYVEIHNTPNPNQIHGWWCFDEKQIKKVEERKLMDILTLYQSKKLEKLNIAENADTENIKYRDENYVKYEELKHLVDTTLPKNKGFSVCFDDSNFRFSDDIKNDLELLHFDYEKKRDKLFALILEIRVQLEMCETYEQKQNILKVYKIIKENGKLNA